MRLQYSMLTFITDNDQVTEWANRLICVCVCVKGRETKIAQFS
jgi:hypothetical protein